MRIQTPLALIFFLIAVTTEAQKLDSVRYKYGHLYYHEFGSGEPIIVLSGGPGNSYLQIQELAVELSKSYRSILLEQRGTGRSIPSPLDSTTINLHSLTDDINLLLDHLRLNNAIILGHSWGGMLAMNFAANYPSRVKSLLLIGPGPYKYSALSVMRPNLRARLGADELARFDLLSNKMAEASASPSDSLERRKLFRSVYVYQKPLSDTVFRKIEVPVYPAMARLLRKDLERSYDLSLKLSNYNGPIHVICGRQDLLAYSTYDLKILRPSVDISWIEETGHFPMFEKPKEFYALLFEVLKRLK